MHACTLPLYLNVDPILLPETCGGVVLHQTMLRFCVFTYLVRYSVCGLSMYHVVYHMVQLTPHRGQSFRQGTGHLNWHVGTHSHTSTHTFICTPLCTHNYNTKPNVHKHTHRLLTHFLTNVPNSEQQQTKHFQSLQHSCTHTNTHSQSQKLTHYPLQTLTFIPSLVTGSV